MQLKLVSTEHDKNWTRRGDIIVDNFKKLKAKFQSKKFIPCPIWMIFETMRGTKQNEVSWIRIVTHLSKSVSREARNTERGLKLDPMLLTMMKRMCHVTKASGALPLFRSERWPCLISARLTWKYIVLISRTPIVKPPAMRAVHCLGLIKRHSDFVVVTWNFVQMEVTSPQHHFLSRALYCLNLVWIAYWQS